MIKISFVGDIMCEQEQLLANKTDDNFNFSSVFENIKSSIDSSDFVVGNLETPLAGESAKYTNHKWSFNSPIEFAKSVKNVGFDLVSTANNHSLDRGIEGLYKTIDALNEISLDHTGTYLDKSEKDKIYIRNISGVKTAFISYTYGTNASFNKNYLKSKDKHAINLFKAQEKLIFRRHIFKRIYAKLEAIIINGFTLNYRLRDLKKKIRNAKHNADLVFILMHSGGQYNIIPDNWTVKLMNYLLKSSVTGVIGCHPHVVQKAFINKNNQIGAFSLGNFCSYPGSESSKMNQSEYSIILHIYIDNISKEMNKVTFQITKSVIDIDGKAKIHSLYNLIKNERNKKLKEILIKDNLLIYNRFLNLQIDVLDIKNEYLMPTQ